MLTHVVKSNLTNLYAIPFCMHGCLVNSEPSTDSAASPNAAAAETAASPNVAKLAPKASSLALAKARMCLSMYLEGMEPHYIFIYIYIIYIYTYIGSTMHAQTLIYIIEGWNLKRERGCPCMHGALKGWSLVKAVHACCFEGQEPRYIHNKAAPCMHKS